MKREEVDIVKRDENNECCVVIRLKLVYLVFRSSCDSLALNIDQQLEIDQRFISPELFLVDI